MYVGSFILGVTKSGKSRGFGYLYGGIDRERLDHILSNSRTPTEESYGPDPFDAFLNDVRSRLP